MEMESNLVNAYLEAYRLSCDSFIKMNPEEVCTHTNGIFEKETYSILLRYLGRDYRVNCRTGDVEALFSPEPVTTTVKVLILHYLVHARIRPLTGNMISFKEIPGGGAIYYQTFYKRAILPLVKSFSNDLPAFLRASERLEGRKERYGHASATIRVFPLVPVTYVLWQGDEEAPASGTILFDESISSFLPGEDIVLAASFGVYELMRLAREEKNG